jgi:hypothetical protein
MWTPQSDVEKAFVLLVTFAGGLAMACMAVTGVVASCVRVDESRLPGLLAKARLGWAAPASGPLPLEAYWWFYRVGGTATLALPQIAELRLATDSFSLALFGPAVLVLAAAEWAIFLAWTGFVLWGFVRAADRHGSLPIRSEGPMPPSKYQLDEKPVWSEPPGGDSAAGGQEAERDGSGHRPEEDS